MGGPCSVAKSCPTPWTTAHQASLSFTISRSLLKLMSIESVMPSNHLMLCHPHLLLPSVFPRSGFFPVSPLFASGGQSIGASASAPVLPTSNVYSGLISFRIAWFDLLAVQGILKSFIQHSSLNASILWCSAFFIVQRVLQKVLFSCPATPQPPSPRLSEAARSSEDIGTFLGSEASWQKNTWNCLPLEVYHSSGKSE